MDETLAKLFAERNAPQQTGSVSDPVCLDNDDDESPQESVVNSEVAASSRTAKRPRSWDENEAPDLKMSASSNKEKVDSMRTGEMKRELESYGIPTNSILEKSELVAALTKARANGLTPKDTTTTSFSTSTRTDAATSKRQERIKKELVKCQAMKASELKQELQNLGVSTRLLVEKSDFAQALAEARADGGLKPRAENHGRVPIKLLTTRLDEQNHQMDSASFRSTHVTLREMLGFDTTEQRQMLWIVACNYLVDFSFLMDTVPELVSCPLSVFFYGSQHSSPEPWRRACTRSDGTCSAHFIQLKPSNDPRTATNPLRYRFRYGVHHTKMFLIGYPDGIRVIIYTANLVPGDTHYKAQGAYIQDFPMKQRGSNGSCQFEKDLVSYIRTYQYQTNHAWDGVNARTLADELGRYDYSSAQVVLIPSTPGYHKIDKQEVGLLKLEKTIREHATSSGVNRHVVCQFSSMGSLSAKWLTEQFLPATSLVDSDTANANSLSDQLKLVYPTVEEIRTSVEGYRGGGSVPGGMKNVSKPLLKPLLCKWSSNRNGYSNPFRKDRNVPHIKSFYQLGDDNASMNWFLLTSHNLSTTAWGQKQKSKYDGHTFFVQHWELGLFLSPKLLGAGAEGRLVPYGSSNEGGGDSIPIPLPYDLVPQHYGPNDEPWAWDAEYSIPDAFGRFSVR